MVAAAREREHVAVELIEELAEVLALLRVGRRDALAHLRRSRPAERRSRVPEPGHEHVDGLVSQPAHGLRVEREWIVVHRGPLPLGGRIVAGQMRDA